MLQPIYVDGAWGWRLVGVISEAIVEQDFETITAVRAHFILPDGRLSRRLMRVPSPTPFRIEGSAQSMKPWPSARPGEGEQEENRRGYHPIWQRAQRTKIGAYRFCSCWRCQGRALAPPIKQITCRRSDALPCARDGSRMAEPRNPACGISRGSVHDSPVVPGEGRAPYITRLI